MTDYLEQAGLIEPPRAARLQPRRLRLHHLHRQLRARCRRRSRRRSRTATWRVCSVLSRQPQLRGPHPPRGEDELPRLAAAGAWPTRSPAAWTWTWSTSRSARADGEPVYLRDIWPTQQEVNEAIEQAIESEMFTRSYGEVFEGDENWNGARRPRGRPLRLGRRLDLREAAAVLRGHARRAARRVRADRGRAGRSRCSATASPPTTSRRPARSRRTRPAGRYLIEHGVEHEGLQLLRLAPRQPRGDDARHVRQRAPAQPAGARAPRAA